MRQFGVGAGRGWPMAPSAALTGARSALDLEHLLAATRARRFQVHQTRQTWGTRRESREQSPRLEIR